MKIIPYNFNKERERKKGYSSKAKSKQLNERILRLESQVQTIFQFIKDYELTLINSSSNETPIYYYKKLQYIKNYLVWACKQLNSNNDFDGYSCTNLFSASQFDTYIKQVDSVLKDYIKLNSDKLFNLRNRTGRSAEGVGNKVTSVDYGKFLEDGIHAHRCLLFGSGNQFTEKELRAILKSRQPNFLSYTILSTFSSYGNIYHDPTLIDIFNKTHNESTKLIYQALDDVSINTLKALLLLSKVACFDFNWDLLNHIYPIILRMAYSLEIDKVNLNTDLENKTFEEATLIIQKYKIWESIVIFATTNHSLFKQFPLGKQFELELPNFKVLKQVYQKYPNPFNALTNQKELSFSFWTNLNEVFLILSKHILTIKDESSKSNLVYLENIRLKNYDLERIQNIINYYFEPDANFIIEEYLRYTKKQPLYIHNYLCRIPNNHCEQHGYHLLIRRNILFCITQILLVNPIMDSNPIQMEVPLKDMLIILEAGIKMFCFYKIITYVYFKNIIELLSETEGNEDLINEIETYLSETPEPNINHYLDVSIYVTIKSLHFENLLYSMYVFLLAITSEDFQLRSNYSNEMMDYLKHNVLIILQILQLAYKSKHIYKKLDIDYTFQRLKIILTNFTISKKFLEDIKSIVNIDQFY